MFSTMFTKKNKYRDFLFPSLYDSGRPLSMLSTPMDVDYVVIGLDMEVQPLGTHNAA